MKKTIISAVLMSTTICAGAEDLNIKDINIRDPFILTDNGTYYMYSSSTADGVGGVAVYTSRDLESWTFPEQVMTLPEGNWSTGGIWAPEVHKYRGAYYLFATVNSPVIWKKEKEGWGASYTHRGTQIFRSKSPMGPFKAISDTQQTPLDYMALDGTLFVEDGHPYMVFCHEWVQTGDGTMEYIQLSRNLSEAVSRPTMMFCASASKIAPPGKPRYVTDGCFMYRTRTGKLLMIWATFGPEGYAECIAESVTGRLSGPWKQQDEPLFLKNGGHAMIFKDLDGRLRLILHSPNGPHGAERARIFLLEDTGDSLCIVEE